MSSSSSPPPTNADDHLDNAQTDEAQPDPQFIDVQITEVVQAQLSVPQAQPERIQLPEYSDDTNNDDAGDDGGNDDDDDDRPPLDPAVRAIADNAAETLVNVGASLIGGVIAPRLGRTRTSSSRSPPLPALPEDVLVHHGGRHFQVGEGGVPEMREIQSPSRIRIANPPAVRPEREQRRRQSAAQDSAVIYRQGSINNRSFREGPVGIVEGDQILGSGYSPNRQQNQESDLDNLVPVLPHSHSQPQRQSQQQQEHQHGGRYEVNGDNGDRVRGRERSIRRPQFNTASRRWSGMSGGGPRLVVDRVMGTLEHARRECSSSKVKARGTGLALNVAIGLQVFISALITGLSASKRGGFGVAILGGIGTIIASYLARARGSNEPELSTTRVRDLERFIRDCEAFIEDYGNEEPGEHTNKKINRFRSEFEELLGNGDGQRKLG